MRIEKSREGCVQRYSSVGQAMINCGFFNFLIDDVDITCALYLMDC